MARGIYTVMLKMLRISIDRILAKQGISGVPFLVVVSSGYPILVGGIVLLKVTCY